MTGIDMVRASLAEARDALQALLGNEATLQAVADAGRLIALSQRQGGTVYSCGNGGSLCDAMHFAEELTGRYRRNRIPCRAQALADPAHISCVANDFGWEHIFSRHLEAFGTGRDVLLAITTSGTSGNVIAAARTARGMGTKVIALTGAAGSPITELADISIVTPGGHWADRVQELHIKVIHILIELVESELGIKGA